CGFPSRASPRTCRASAESSSRRKSASASRVGEGSSRVLLIGGDEPVELVVDLEPEQPLGLPVPQGLVVIRVEPEELPLVLDRLLSPVECPERLGERCAGAHVRAGLEDAPEMADVLLERLRSESALAGGETLLEKLARLLDAPR